MRASWKRITVAAALGVAAVVVCAFGDGPATRRAAATRVVATGPTSRPAVGDAYVERVGEEWKASFEMVFVPGGTFWMGSPEDEAGREASEGPRHRVKVEPFWMGRYEMTAEMVQVWYLEWGTQSGRWGGPRPRVSAAATRAATDVPCEAPYGPFYDGSIPDGMPAVALTAYGAQQFCQWLTLRTGRYYRLPTEAEWEYACRAGSETAYPFGADAGKLDQYAWFGGAWETHPIGRKAANAWGLHDMLGNAGEYVLDGWGEGYREFADRVASDPWRRHDDRAFAVVRGGDNTGKAPELRAAARRRVEQGRDAGNISKVFNYDLRKVGFRVVSPLRPQADGRDSCIPVPPE